MGHDLYGFADLGTFNIRFSITSLSSSHARLLPYVFQDRAPVSLYKGPGVPIEDSETADAIASLLRFKSICKDYCVPQSNVIVAANLQEAPNFDKVCGEIESRLGWTVARLGKHGESWANVYGVASCFHEPCGIYVELRRKAAYLYWMRFHDEKEEASAPIEIPYGYDILGSHTATQINAFIIRLNEALPSFKFRERRHVWHVYLSSSGFGGLSNVLMSRYPKSPIPLVNGLKVSVTDLREWPLESHILAGTLRAIGQVLDQHHAKHIYYCRHNLRDGLLFQSLPREIRREDPLIVATRPYSLQGARALTLGLHAALPQSCPSSIRNRLVPAVANSAYIHSTYPHEMQASAALTCAVTGVLSGAHGLTHEDRALIGLALCNRWGGHISGGWQCVRDSLLHLAKRHVGWWALFLGWIMHLLGCAYPGAHVREGIIELSCSQASEKSVKLNVRLSETSVYSRNAIMGRRLSYVCKCMRELNDEFRGEKVPVIEIHTTS